MGATMLLSATSNDVSVNVRLVGWLSPDTRGSTHSCGNNIDVKPIMQNNITLEGTCVVGQRVGTCGGSVELVKRKRETLEGTCVGHCIGSG